MNNEIFIWIMTAVNLVFTFTFQKYWQHENEQKYKKIAELEAKLEFCRELLKERML